MNKIIEMFGITKTYNRGGDEVKALDGVSLNIKKGEFVAIIGRSGSGKSTLMNIMGCLDAPQGVYRLNGCDVSKMNDNELSKVRNMEIGFIFQSFNLIAGLTARENVELPLIYRGVHRDERKKMAIEALERVGLKTRLSHKPSQMSGGQQQRVAIARAIVAKPPILLADEPTGNLDSKSGADIIKILHELHDEGKTIILITHDMKLAYEAERVVKIADGKIKDDSYNR
ncbi:MAG: ABC transporter ATP-binding protein [Oscillospiraceae bacterium]|nr:ABC transporter ATP-binding protein [Oscillospiraceae bacterium]